MSVRGTVDKLVGHAKEEVGEALKNKKLAQEGRVERNIGKIENGEAPDFSEPGTKRQK